MSWEAVQVWRMRLTLRRRARRVEVFAQTREQRARSALSASIPSWAPAIGCDGRAVACARAARAAPIRLHAHVQSYGAACLQAQDYPHAPCCRALAWRTEVRQRWHSVQMSRAEAACAAAQASCTHGRMRRIPDRVLARYSREGWEVSGGLQGPTTGVHLLCRTSAR